MKRMLYLLPLLLCFSGLAVVPTPTQNITNYPQVTNILDGDMFFLSNIGDRTNRNVTMPVLKAQILAGLTNPALSASLTNAGTLTSNQFLLSQSSWDRTRPYPGPPFCFALYSGMPGIGGATAINESTILQEATNAWQLGIAKYVGPPILYFDVGWTTENFARTNNHLYPWIGYSMPDGMKFIADRLHSLGCGFGLYLIGGNDTTVDSIPDPDDPLRASSIGTAYIDGQDLASWGVDYVRVDGGSTTVEFQKQWISSFIAGFNSVREANPIDSPIPHWLLEVAVPQKDYPGVPLLNDWITKKVDVLRTAGDVPGALTGHDAWYVVSDDMDRTTNFCRAGVYSCINSISFFNKAGTGQYDYDDLTAMAGISAVRHSQIALGDPPGYVLAHPFDPAWTKVLTNPTWLDVWKDSLAIQAYMVSSNASSRVYVSPLANGDWAVCLWNRTTNVGNTLTLSCNFTNFIGLGARTNVLQAVDIMTGTNLLFTNAISVAVNAHAAATFRMSPPAESKSYFYTTYGTPTLLYTNDLTLWYFAGATNFPNGYKTNWPSYLGYGGTMQTDSAENAPKYLAVGPGSLPTYQFDNSAVNQTWNAYYSFLNSGFSNALGDFTVIFVGAPAYATMASAYARWWDIGEQTGIYGPGPAFGQNSSTYQAFLNGQPLLSAVNTNGGAAVCAMMRSGAMLYLLVNGTLVSTNCSTAEVAQSTPLTLGNRFDNLYSPYLSGYISEFMLYTNALTWQQLTNVAWQYLAWKYQCSAPYLPDSHTDYIGPAMGPGASATNLVIFSTNAVTPALSIVDDNRLSGFDFTSSSMVGKSTVTLGQKLEVNALTGIGGFAGTLTPTNGLVMYQLPLFPTNWVPPSTAAITNFLHINLTNYGPVWVATNPGAANWVILKPDGTITIY